MTNSYDSAYDELPSCCCDGVEENEKLKRENGELMKRCLAAESGASNAIARLNKALSKNHDHDMRIAEVVLEACEIAVATYYGTGAGSLAIRNINFSEVIKNA